MIRQLSIIVLLQLPPGTAQPVDAITSASLNVDVKEIVRPVLLAIDMQNDTLTGPIAAAAVTKAVGPVVQAMRRLIDVAHEAAIPVIYTRIAFRQGYVDASPESPARLLGRGLLDGEWGANVIDDLEPAPSDVVITKKRTSAFYGTDLDILLRCHDAHSLILTGATTNRAVESTVRDAHARDYHAIVVSDATVGMSPALHAGALRSIADFFGEVATTDEVLAALVRAGSRSAKPDGTRLRKR